MAIEINQPTEAPVESPVKPPARRLRWWQVLVFLAVMVLLAMVALQMRRNGPLAAAHGPALGDGARGRLA